MKRLKKSVSIVSLLLIVSLGMFGCNYEVHSDKKQSGKVQIEATLEATNSGQTGDEVQNEDFLGKKKKTEAPIETPTETESETYTVDTIPSYHGIPYIYLKDNMPDFSDEDKERVDAFETYSKLDSLGRCGVAYANICKELMPTKERQSIGKVKPSGWHTVKYNGIVDGNYLYNRCHLIGYQLAAENANEKNLITGTRYLNIDGMLSFEDAVSKYVQKTNNHVLYRVTPIFVGNDLVARGVQMEAWSVEDGGKGICFHVFCYNAQPGITIDYATGDSEIAKETATPYSTPENGQEENKELKKFVINRKTKKFHLPECSNAVDMIEENKIEVESTEEDLIKDGFSPCKKCVGK